MMWIYCAAVGLFELCGTFFQTYFSVPAWVEKVYSKYRDVLELFTAIKYVSFTHTTLGKKIKGGIFLKDIFERLKNRTLGAMEPNRLFISLTHGHAIVNILNTLGVYEVNICVSALDAFRLHGSQQDRII